MKLGVALIGPAELNDRRLSLARQLGCRSIVAWMPLPKGDGVWLAEDFVDLKRLVNSHDLELAAIENLHPAHWDQVLLGESGRDAQIAKIQQTIGNMGEAGIPCLGYCFSVVGVWGHWSSGDNQDGRGGAGIKRFDAAKITMDEPPDNQSIWWFKLENRSRIGTLPPVSMDEMWARLTYFLSRVLPVAEKAGVKLAAHPDDPPVPVLRKMARLFHSVENYKKLMEMFPSESNCIEFCQGSFAEMAGCDLISTIRYFAANKKIAYVHFRNVSASVPKFDEVFIDEGYVNMLEALRAYHEAGFDGTLIPDHSPRVAADDAWGVGMAYALGYMKACLQVLGISE